jgi:hypothetical protein
MPKFRYVAVQPARIEQQKKLGPASYLHDFLVDHQTDAAGNVNYGKPFGYAWVRARWLNAPTIRTLQRHMARLKRSGLIRVRVLGFGGGMMVRVIGSAKWQAAAPAPAEQIQMFGAKVLAIASGKACGKVVDSDCVPDSHDDRSVVHGRHICRRKEVKNLREETNSAEPAARSG